MITKKVRKTPSAAREEILGGSSILGNLQKLSVAELIENYAYSEAIIETIREPLLVLDRNLNVKTANKAFFETFSMTKKETYGHYVYDLNGGEWNIPELKKLLEKIVPKNTHFNDFIVTHNFDRIGNKIMLLNARRIVLEGNKTQLILLAIEDITEKKKLEQQKEDFLNIASHELKTPLTTLKAYAQILGKRLGEGADEKNEHFVSRINKQADKMVSIIQDILDASRLNEKALKLSKKKFDLDRFVRNIVDDFQYTTDNHIITIAGMIGREVIADKERIGQVLVNFITNAIKYSPGEKSIKIVLKTDNGNAVVSVQDYGIGIPKEKQALVFDRYYRVKEGGEKPGVGFGLGLYISSEIIKQHGGRIGVKKNNSKEKGSVFWFSLPLE